MSLAGKTIFISGASRGIGLAIGLRAARDGANIVIAAKTAKPHPKLPGTIYTAADDIEKAGGKALPCVVDIRSEEQVRNAINETVKKFGGIDVLVNNASAISLTDTLTTDMKRFDLMMGINTRGTYLCSRECIPHLIKSSNPHILNISPPLNMNPRWFRGHVAYTMAKYGMSMCVLGMAGELEKHRIAVNALWPKTAIHTAAMEMLGGDEIAAQCRTPEIVADAAHLILTKPSNSFTGQFVIDEQILKDNGVSDLSGYLCVPGTEDSIMPDFFLDDFDQSKSSMSASSGGDGINGIMKKISSLMGDGDMRKEMNAVYAFNLTDLQKSWTIDFVNGEVGETKDGSKANCTMKMASNDFVSMFGGKLKPMVAFSSGKLRIEGDMMKAMKLEKMMKKMHQSSKL